MKKFIYDKFGWILLFAIIIAVAYVVIMNNKPGQESSYRNTARSFMDALKNERYTSAYNLLTSRQRKGYFRTKEMMENYFKQPENRILSWSVTSDSYSKGSYSMEGKVKTENGPGFSFTLGVSIPQDSSTPSVSTFYIH